MKKHSILLMLMLLAFMTISAQNPQEENAKETPSNVSLVDMINQKSNNYVIYKEHVSSLSGIRHVYIRQAINGLEVYGTESSVHIDASGKTVTSHNYFLDDIKATVKSDAQSLSADQAISAVASQMGYPISNLQKIKDEDGVNQKSLFNKAGISLDDIPVKLMYYYRQGEGTILVWELSIAERNSSDWWNFRVDAATGQIIDKDNLTHECFDFGEHSHETSKKTSEYFNLEGPVNNTALFDEVDGIGTYRVYAMPVESPLFGSRSLVVGPENALASPFGWHDTDGAVGAEFTNTRGNNVSAWDDEDGNDTPDGAYTASPGGDLVFDFPLNTTYSAADQSTNAATTNLFYWNNIIHDVMYQYGFDEAAGNFQENNYGNGGLGGDSVNALAQSGKGTCNANFGTPIDGNNPRMRMYVCDDEDGDLDNWVIVHEYGHGIHSRLNTTGGAERMNEGWGDYYGLMLTMQAGQVNTTSRGFGNFAFNSIFGADGARTFPYSTDFTVNSHTYDDINTEVAPHGVGSVWAMMLWEMTWELIAIHGFDTDFYNGSGGNNISLALVTEGLKLQPANAGFVDGRDAILLADQNLYGGANQCAIWNAFARRGLGFSADQGTSASKTDGTEAFDVPDPPVAVCVAPFAIQLDANLEASIDASDIDDGSTALCGIASLSVSPNTFDCDDIGDVEVTLTVTDNYGNEATCTTTVTVEKSPTTLTYDGDLEGQYTDPVDLSATLLDDDGNGLSGKTINFKIGSQTDSAVTDGSGLASLTLILDQDPNNLYTVDVAFDGDTCYAGSDDSDPFDILQEDANVEYTGHTLQATPNAGSSTATVVLSANIQDEDDGHPGDITNALVLFIDRDTNIAISPWIPVTDLFDPSDPTIGSVSYEWEVNLGNLSSKTFTVGIIVGGCYTQNDSADDTVVTVYKPKGDFITGGGYIFPDESAGSYASTPGLKANFGFNVKYNKKGKKLKGHMNIIFRRDEGGMIRTYQIKGNAIQSLGVDIADPGALFGEFITKANLNDITDPLFPISLGGNLSLKVEMTDRGEPGIDDSIGINLIDANGILLYSSNWSGISTEEMMLSGGNLVVHSGFCTISSDMQELGENIVPTVVFDISIEENPFDNKASLSLISTDETTQVTYSVYDSNNKFLYSATLKPDQKFKFGNGIKSGMYLVTVQQGNNKTQIRMIKK
ncbi:MAG: T9SS type A sorting domain-containing protein [Saprospiraceae bacterium]|nr:T9SS type A sorting domain-containing protein [Saprospiraceae bacterium]